MRIRKEEKTDAGRGRRCRDSPRFQGWVGLGLAPGSSGSRLEATRARGWASVSSKEPESHRVRLRTPAAARAALPP